MQRSFQGLQLFIWVLSNENHNLRIKLVFTFESPKNLFHFDVVLTTICEIYFKEERGGSSQVQATWVCFLWLCAPFWLQFAIITFFLFLYIDFSLNSTLWTCTNPISKPQHHLTLWKIENMPWIYIIYRHTQCIGGYNSPKWWAMENQGMVPTSMHKDKGGVEEV